MPTDTERLDWLDRMNAALNQHYGTNYGWRLILNHNVTRLFTGPHANGFVGDLDLNDAEGGAAKLPSCRAAIDQAMSECHPKDGV